jgi:hypothetical protein
MLQITTGKLFTRSVGRENQLRGVLYTNLYLEDRMNPVLNGPFFGRLAQAAEASGSPKMLVWEFIERIEEPESGPQFVISHCADSYLQDMATVLSFAFNCTCSPDIEIVRRLTAGQRGVSTGQAPNRLVRRVFDREVFSQPGEADEFVRFYTQLMGLPRKTYLGVMRAIRTYVTGMQRVADDLELAYTLLVAAGESMAQDFDAYDATWDSVSEQKRSAIDEALGAASVEVAEAVRAAILSTEHTALARRFQAFILANVDDGYFRSGFPPDGVSLGRCDLQEALASAYKARSLYVHQLRSLPDMVSIGHGHVESVLENRRCFPTLQGLSRLIRHAILTFVSKQPTLDREPYKYLSELAGVIQAPLAPNYWVGHVQGDIAPLGRRKLEGFLEELALAQLKSPGATVTSLTEVLQKFLEDAPNMKTALRRPYLALLVLFDAIAGSMTVGRTETIELLIQSELSNPSPEALVARALFSEVPHWTIEVHEKALEDYFKQRGQMSGLRLPRLFEAAVTIELAERNRAGGPVARARELVVMASENYPDHERLRNCAENFLGDEVLNWWSILLPERPVAIDCGSSASEDSVA